MKNTKYDIYTLWTIYTINRYMPYIHTMHTKNRCVYIYICMYVYVILNKIYIYKPQSIHNIKKTTYDI